MRKLLQESIQLVLTNIDKLKIYSLWLFNWIYGALWQNVCNRRSLKFKNNTFTYLKWYVFAFDSFYFSDNTTCSDNLWAISSFDNISFISLFLLFWGLIITIYINNNKNPRKSKGDKSDVDPLSIIIPILAHRAYLNFDYYKSLL